MNSRRWMAASAAAVLIGSAASAAAAEDTLHGWWRADVAHNGESEPFYLHFGEQNGKPRATFSIPAITADQSPIGPFASETGKVNFPAVGWSLDATPGRSALEGVLPAALVPVQKLKVRFERSDPPPPRPQTMPRGPAPAAAWRVSLGSPVYAGLAFDPRTNAVLAATDAGAVVALDRRSGARRWARDLGSPIRATPTITGDSVFIAADDKIARLNLRTGRLLWSTPLGKPRHPRLEITEAKSRWDHYSSSAVVSGGLVVAGSRDGCIHAMRHSDGRPVQRICAEDAITATPIVRGGRVYFGSFDHYVHAADLRTGATVWKADMKEPVTRDLLDLDGAIVAGSRSYDLTAFDTATGRPRWNHYMWFSWIDSAPVQDGRRIIIGSSDAQRVFAIDGSTGRRLWSTFIGGWAWARPAVHRRSIYAGAVGTSIKYVGERTGGLAAIDRDSGTLRWLFRPPHHAKATLSGFASAPVAAGDRLVAADLEGNVYAFAERP